MRAARVSIRASRRSLADSMFLFTPFVRLLKDTGGARFGCYLAHTACIVTQPGPAGRRPGPSVTHNSRRGAGARPLPNPSPGRRSRPGEGLRRIPWARRASAPLSAETQFPRGVGGHFVTNGGGVRRYGPPLRRRARWPAATVDAYRHGGPLLPWTLSFMRMGARPLPNPSPGRLRRPGEGLRRIPWARRASAPLSAETQFPRGGAGGGVRRYGRYGRYGPPLRRRARWPAATVTLIGTVARCSRGRLALCVWAPDPSPTPPRRLRRPGEGLRRIPWARRASAPLSAETQFPRGGAGGGVRRYGRRGRRRPRFLRIVSPSSCTRCGWPPRKASRICTRPAPSIRASKTPS